MDGPGKSLTYVTNITPAAGNENAVSKAVGDPEDLFNAPGHDHAHSFINQRNENKWAYLRECKSIS